MPVEVVLHPRKADWLKCLLDYLVDNSGRPFEWGQHDCLTFTLGAVDAMTGTRLKEVIVGKYHDEATASEACKVFGYISHAHFIYKTFPRRPSKLHIMRGDIIFTRGLNGGAALGIAQGPNSYVLSPEGLLTVNNRHVTSGFAV